MAGFGRRMPVHKIASGQIVLGRRRGRGVRRVPGQMNNTERMYAEHLEQRKQLGEVKDFWFDAIKIRLADKTFYEPDFLVLLSNMDMEIHEVKGTKREKKADGEVRCTPFVEDDAAVKIKVVADKYPFRVFMTWLDGLEWKRKEI